MGIIDEEETKTSDENRTKEENGDGKKNEVKSEAAPKTTPKIWVRRFSNDNTCTCFSDSILKTLSHRRN